MVRGGGWSLNSETAAHLETLRVQGITAEVLTVGAPLQIAGTHSTGESFYFRVRWEVASLDVGPAPPPDADPKAANFLELLPAPSWTGEEDVPAEDADQLVVLGRLLDRYTAGTSRMSP
jgi:hypothetical protein